MKFKSVVLVIFFLVLLIGCDAPEKNNAKSNLYFDIKGVLRHQIILFKKTNPKIEKTATLNGNTSKSRLNKVDWNKELKPFESIDINKSIYKGTFLSLSKTTDTGLVNYYFKKAEAKADIQSLKVIFTKSNKLQSIEGLEKTSNPVFSSQRKYLMNFDTSNLKLKSYELTGWQGFRFFKRDSFSVEGVVVE